MEVKNLRQKLSQFSDCWNPRIAGRLNGQLVKLVKISGEFIWHKHDGEDELFLVISGKLKMEFENEVKWLDPGEFIIVPKGMMHRPSSDGLCEILLFEPETTCNTGEIQNERTRNELEEI